LGPPMSLSARNRSPKAAPNPAVGVDSGIGDGDPGSGSPSCSRAVANRRPPFLLPWGRRALMAMAAVPSPRIRARARARRRSTRGRGRCLRRPGSRVATRAVTGRAGPRSRATRRG